MQLRFKDTAHLPMNLWKAFSRFDADGSGRIERDEFSHVSAVAGGMLSVQSEEQHHRSRASAVAKAYL